jgi:outer membrane protein assembly factor BamA
MRLPKLSLLLALGAGRVLCQTAALPLESVVVQGSPIPRSVVLEIAGLRLNSPIDKAAIDDACRRLQESGLFSSISYRSSPTPGKGYALTLILTDQTPLSAATIDVPGADETEAWKWLVAKFHRFDHQVPQVDEAQKYLAREIEGHLASGMRSQHVTVRMEADLKTRRMTVSFQPEVLPRIQSVAFTGNRAIAAAELTSALSRVVTNEGYTERKFAGLVEMNLRPLYEQYGYYRVQFAPGGPQWTDTGVSLNLGIVEGPLYRLGKVELLGDNLPVDAMLSAAKFPSGECANWRQIQQGIWDMERVVKRTGFFEAAASPERSSDDALHLLDLHIRIAKGPLYHFGEVRIVGLSPDLQAKARKAWKPQFGDPFDFGYSNDFFQAFSRMVDLRAFRKYKAEARKAAGDHVMDIDLVFEPR